MKGYCSHCKCLLTGENASPTVALSGRGYCRTCGKAAVAGAFEKRPYIRGRREVGKRAYTGAFLRVRLYLTREDVFGQRGEA